MGSEMCIRDRYVKTHLLPRLYAFELMMAPYAIAHMKIGLKLFDTCLLYTSDAADERSSVDLGGRRIIKKKHTVRRTRHRAVHTLKYIRCTYTGTQAHTNTN